MKNLALTLFSFLILTSCAFAPFHTTKSARSLGDGKQQVDAGVSPLFYLGYERGFGENLDLRFGIERQFGLVFSATAKYSLVNSEEGFSFAPLFGLAYGVSAFQSKSVMAGAIGSYKRSWFEPYLTSRYNYVHFDGGELESEDGDDLLFDSIETFHISYVQTTLGFNFWFSDSFALNINGKVLHIVDGNAENDTNVIPSITFIFR